MAATGITCTDAVIKAYQNFKLRRGPKFIIFKIDGSSVVIDRLAEEGQGYDDMLGLLPDDSCRYVVFDYEYHSDGRQQDKILFINWMPDSSGVRTKMIYSGTKAEVKRVLEGIGLDLQANDRDDVSEKAVLRALGA